MNRVRTIQIKHKTGGKSEKNVLASGSFNDDKNLKKQHELWDDEQKKNSHSSQFDKSNKQVGKKN